MYGILRQIYKEQRQALGLFGCVLFFRRPGNQNNGPGIFKAGDKYFVPVDDKFVTVFSGEGSCI